MKRQSEDRKDAKIRMPGAMDRGPVQFDSRAAKRAGDVLTIATNEVVTAPPTTTIISAVKIMTSYGFGRLPIADAGTRRLLGFVTGVDVVDFLGGGIRHNLLKKKYEGNILAAINADIREIMSPRLISIGEKASVEDALKLMYEKNVGGLPVVDEEARIKALITEHDFAKLVAGVNTGIKVEEFMSPTVITANGQISIEKTTRIMVQQGGFRKLPVVQDSILIGMVTASDIMRYLGSGEAFEKVVTGDIGEVMSQPIKTLVRRDLVSTGKDVDLGWAAEMMMEKGVGALPVMDKGSLQGIITKRDFIRAFAEEKRGIIP
ncbi:MAG: CBS domain-containing protein [Methanothrix sp.]|jgi:CBS domain-containing protein|nr:CBS domain-containing protein [Methanothrix sp.]OPX81730.1 MAG: Inosine-5'-monophosphate dehydrogenase [Methanosaeta sp. PtaB.Bin087]OPY55144.1 MAG: Inosine-5'-monophosphate dehydrogenase [Methanosaeta sp. PtaU1.Bin055]NLX40230.1 CBS domain-containing protein [Methanothrix sp.]HOI69001.1 CBS domain-containing protein [Methanothrix sp.]